MVLSRNLTKSLIAGSSESNNTESAVGSNCLFSVLLGARAGLVAQWQTCRMLSMDGFYDLSFFIVAQVMNRSRNSPHMHTSFSQNNLSTDFHGSSCIHGTYCGHHHCHQHTPREVFPLVYSLSTIITHPNINSSPPSPQCFLFSGGNICRYHCCHRGFVDVPNIGR